MRFDWKRFCDAHRIDYDERGPNTAKGNITIHCPLCGGADEGKHMGLDLNPNNPRWACWRDSRHRGRKPAYLVAALLNISIAEAADVVKGKTNPDHFERTMDALKDPEAVVEEEEVKRPATVEMPKELRRFEEGGPRSQYAFYHYLAETRGFKNRWLEVAWRYDLRYTLVGTYAWRVIVPVYHGGKLVSWSGRSISETALIRYKALEDHLSPMNIKDTLLLPPAYLRVPRSLLIVSEGQFDALKLAAFTDPREVTATCLFGMSVQRSQVPLLKRLGKMHQKRVVLLDEAEDAACGRICDELNELTRMEWTPGRVPAGAKDPGAMSGTAVKRLVNELQRGT